MKLDLIANSVIDRCESTNDIARELGEAGFPHGTWISAREQTRGRGRLGRVWQSNSGNLFLSIVLRWASDERAFWTWVPLAAAVGVARELDLSVKWPNDLWIDGAKAGGLLCEAVGNRAGSFIVLGLGLNCSSAPEGLDQKTAALGRGVDEVRPLVLRAALGAIDVLARSGPAETIAGYRERAAIAPGALIEWGESGIGIVHGLGESGELVVKTAGEKTERLYAEDVKIRLSSRENPA
jgi:BirA family biotin operon repressor/biotin-[acetyl-CoA-carboxylase] ligase